MTARPDPIPFRPTSLDNRTWLDAYARESGRSRNNLLDEALADLRAKHTGNTQAAKVRRRSAPGHALTCKCLICRPEGQRR